MRGCIQMLWLRSWKSINSKINILWKIYKLFLLCKLMNQDSTERIEVRKIYVGRAAIFGLLYGLVLGLIIGIYFFASSLIGLENNLTLFGKELKIVGIGIGSIVLVGATIFFSIASCIFMIIGSFVYNLISQIGGALHLGLAEREQQISIQWCRSVWQTTHFSAWNTSSIQKSWTNLGLQSELHTRTFWYILKNNNY